MAGKPNVLDNSGLRKILTEMFNYGFEKDDSSCDYVCGKHMTIFHDDGVEVIPYPKSEDVALELLKKLGMYQPNIKAFDINFDEETGYPTITFRLYIMNNEDWIRTEYLGCE